MVEGDSAFWTKKTEIAKYNLDHLHKTEEESDAEFYARQLAAQKEYDDARIAEAQREADEEQLAYENKAAQIAVKGPDSFEYYQANLDAAIHYYDALIAAGRLETETEEEYAARRIAAEQRVADARKALVEAQIGYWSDLATGIGSIMGSIADMYEQDIKEREKRGDITEEQAKKEFENVKAMQIAEATINTIAGAVAAFMSCQSLGQPWGAILGAVQAAAVTAAGVAEIAKIKKTQYGSSNTGGLSNTALAAAQPSMTDYTAQPVTTYTGQDDTDTLVNALTKAPLKAYVVESEVTSKQELARQRDENSTF